MALEQNRSKPKKNSIGILVVDLVEAQEEIRKIEREVGRMNSKTQIQYLMDKRKNLLSRIESMKSELARKIPDYDPIDLGLFQCVYRVLVGYGRGVGDSILWTFEGESGHQLPELVNYPESFFSCVSKILGKQSAKKVESSVIFEICNDYGMQLSRNATISDAIRIAKISLKHLHSSPIDGARERTL